MDYVPLSTVQVAAVFAKGHHPRYNLVTFAVRCSHQRMKCRMHDNVIVSELRSALHTYMFTTIMMREALLALLVFANVRYCIHDSFCRSVGRTGDYLAVNYGGFAPLLVEGVKELDRITTAQQRELHVMRLELQVSHSVSH